MICDLHIHTKFSDGWSSVEEVLRKAKENNVKIISITDHNVFEAHKLIKDKNIIVGMEICVEYLKKEYHFVMYGFDINNKYIKEYEKKVLKHDIKGFKDKVKRLKELYNIDIDKSKLKDFIDRNVYFDRVRLNNLLVELNIVDDPEDAFYKYTHAVPENSRLRITLEELFELEKNTNSVVSLAHPTKYFDNMNDIEDFILMLKNKHNLRCVEVITSRATLEEQEKLKKICTHNNLYISGGSDYHGDTSYKGIKKIGYGNKDILKRELTIFEILGDIW